MLDLRLPLSRFLPPYRVRTWLTLASACCILPMLTFALVLLVRSAHVEKAESEQEVQLSAHILAADVDREVRRIVASAEVLAGSASLASGDLRAFYDHAVQVRTLLGTEVQVRDLAHHQLVNTALPWGTPLTESLSFEVDERAIQSRRPEVSGLIIGNTTNGPEIAVVICSPRQGEARYLISLTFPEDRIQAVLLAERLPPGWLSGIVDSNGIMMARSEDPLEIRGAPFPAKRWQEIKDAPAGVHHTTNLKGHEVVQAYAMSATTGWVVGVSADRRVTAAVLRQSILILAAAGLLLTLATMMAALAFGRRLSRPINRLTRVAEAVQQGVNVPDDPADHDVLELQGVGDALKQAAQAIHMRTSTLEQARTEADLANQAKSRFLAAISHDIRQPVQSLTLFNTVLAARLPADHQAGDLLARMDKSIQAMHMLLDSFTEIARLDAGLVAPCQVDFPLGPMLEWLERAYQPLAAAKGLKLRVVRTRATVHSDAELLERILRHFLENALRYTERGGVLVGCRRRSDKVSIQVIDTGIGIPADYLDRVYEEFVQVDNPERDRTKGLGLGLAVVKRTARLLGHTLVTCSVPGTGSTFAIEAPWTRNAGGM